MDVVSDAMSCSATVSSDRCRVCCVRASVSRTLSRRASSGSGSGGNSGGGGGQPGDSRLVTTVDVCAGDSASGGLIPMTNEGGFDCPQLSALGEFSSAKPSRPRALFVTFGSSRGEFSSNSISPSAIAGRVGSEGIFTSQRTVIVLGDSAKMMSMTLQAEKE